MWRISALDRDGREVGRFELVGGELTIGRDADRQLVLPSASVSRRHARVFLDGGQPCIVDEGSANGVIVDGVRITQPTYVNQATRIDVAEFHLALEPLGGADVMAPSRVPRMTPVPGTMPSTEPPMRLVAEGGPYDGRVFELTGAELAVGRAVDNDVVLDDPSLSRKHAKIFRRGPGELEIEDLGSSNGTFINQRKIGRGSAHPGDTLRFGELSFRVEGDTLHGTSAVTAELPRNLFMLLAGGAALTFIMLVLMLVFLVRKPTPVQAPGKDAIARISRQADSHVRMGKSLIGDRKYLEAKSELDQALELDPANAEARRLRNLAVRAPEDEKTASAAIVKIGIGDRTALDGALRLLDETTEGTPARQRLREKLSTALVSFGNSQCMARAWSDCAWALCRAWEVAPPDGKPDGATTRTLRDAERKIHDRSYVRCRAAP
ncbi:MAG TPA: FHA domain-containing protein [Polyangia bacterium]|jgi:pSer/pThr/pTyr-binding forkhead associated (FHA) protein